jgi:rare lipoprotein A
VVKLRTSASARRGFRNALMATALSAMLTDGASMGAALAHGRGVKKAGPKQVHQSERLGDGNVRQRGVLRDKLAASARFQSLAQPGTSGIASVYCDRRTASGEQMSSGAMTAAHRTLPFGTQVTVLNRNNGRSAIVRINDRGPFVRGRVIDLSPAAAQALKVDGLAPVSLIVESGADHERDQKLPNDAKESSPQNLATPSCLSG